MAAKGTRRKVAARAKAEKQARGRIAANLKTARKVTSSRAASRVVPPTDRPAPPAFVASKVLLVPISKLRPLAKNPRVHSDQQIDEIVRSISTFGFLVPLLVHRKTMDVLAGNGRYAAAVRLELPKVPVIYADHLTPAQRRAFVIADNAIATHATWDDVILAEYFQAIERAGLSLDVTAFSREEIDEIYAAVRPKSAADADEAVPALPVKPKSKPGDLWLLGSHRLLCGDATNPDHVLRLVNGAAIDCVWTDPPYGVSYSAAAGEIQNDDLPERELAAMLTAALASAYAVMADGAPIYMAHADTGGHIFRRVLIETGFKLSSCLIWRKSSLVLGRADYHWQHEPILYGWKPGAAHRWYGNRDKTTLLEFDDPPFAQVGEDEWHLALGETTLVIRGKALTVELLRGTVFFEEKPRVSLEHPTMKPVPLIDRMLRNSAKAGARVLDPFAGSGSTLVACEQRSLVGYMLELDPRFVDVIVRRWQQITGRKATLSSTGRTFDQVSTGRKKGE